MRDLFRVLKARRLAVIGGGAWCEDIMDAAARIGFTGQIHPVHPSGKEIGGIASVPSIEALPQPPDVAFIGVNRHATIEIVQALRARGAGGAVCFASGFSETGDGADLQAGLVAAAGEMPILGPNCYGFVNALDGVAVWPDQHGMTPVTRGVAVLLQSSNIAINVTMQRRALPLAYVIACGNQAQTTQAQMAMALLDDPRVTAIGLHVEGFGDTAAWHAFATRAAEKSIPVVAIKAGASSEAQLATVSHTASLAGTDAGADALLRHLGFGRAHDLPTFLETLKLLHCEGALSAPTVSCISCSGGEASLAADTVMPTALKLPPLSDPQKKALTDALGPKVTVANPLDYHTYVWRDVDAMTAAWLPMASDVGLTMSIVDYPHTDATDWECATQAALRVRAASERPFAVVATLPELMPVEVAERLMAGGVVPLFGLREAVSATEIAAYLPDMSPLAPWQIDGEPSQCKTLTEAEAKFELSSQDLDLPRRVEATREDLAQAAQALMAPLALKGVGLAHKSDAGAVALGLSHAELDAAALRMPGDRFLVEEMITDGVAELLVGVTRDPAHGLVLTIGAGGVMTEVMQDTVSLLMPASEDHIIQALTKLKCHVLLTGFRGRPQASIPAVVAAVLAIQRYVGQHRDQIAEVEVNPLICTPTRAVAVDALIRRE